MRTEEVMGWRREGKGPAGRGPGQVEVSGTCEPRGQDQDEGDSAWLQPGEDAEAGAGVGGVRVR